MSLSEKESPSAHAPLVFEKYEGLGNDFVVIDAAREDAVTSERAIDICDRRHGVGADGVLLVLPPRGAGDARMKVLNADGSVPEMCGNGLRCVALRVARARGLATADMSFDTDAGARRCLVDDAGGRGLVTVDMGVVRVDGPRTIDAGGASFTVEVADAGNPHAILFGEWARWEVESIGPRIATAAAFPSGTNVEFARAKKGEIDLVVWERGVGVTLACGTGACATAAVACARDHAAYDTPIAVHLPGGTLDITIDRATGRAIMRGPARRVFGGQL
jgi:diaminopimelate epimerase